MVRLARLLAYFGGLMVCAGMAFPAYSVPGDGLKLDDPARCRKVEAGKPINFDGQTLIETPDLPPELRLANALIGANCLTRGKQVQNQFLAAHPDDYRVSFVDARMAWATDNSPQSEAIGDQVLAQHPDFSSMLILMGSVATDQLHWERAQKMLDAAYKLQPQDLWGYIDQLRIEKDLAPSSLTYKRMRAVIKNPEFPRDIRNILSRDARLQLLTSESEVNKRFEDGIAQLDRLIALMDCDVAKQAATVIEFHKDPAKGVQLIQESVKPTGRCAATPETRVLLSEAYLLQAAAIAPQPTDANRALVQQAKDILNGDLTGVARRAAMHTPVLDPLIPFFKGNVDSVGQDAMRGSTTLCIAFNTGNLALIKEELENGAHADEGCFHYSLVHLVIMTSLDMGPAKIPTAQSVLRTLLERGVKPGSNDLDICARKSACAENMLPILREFD